MISGRRPSLRSRASASIRPSAMVGNPPASATLEANSGTSVIQDMAPWIKGYLVPISLATGLSKKQSFFASARRHKFRISPMKAFTASSVPAPKRSTNDRAKVASTPRGMTSSCVKWLSRGWRALACTWFTKERRLSSVISAAHSESWNRLDLLERTRVSLVEKATGNLQVQADQIGRIQAEFGELPALEIINGNQVCQPMDALEDDPRRPCGQECRCRLRGGDASPDEDVERLRGCAQHFLDHRIESQGRLTAHESRGLAPFQDDAPDSRAILQNRCQQIQVTDDGKATVVLRQLPQSL